MIIPASIVSTQPAAKYAKSRSYPGDPKCANYDSAKKNIIVEKISSNLISTRAILQIWYLPSLCSTRFTIFKSNAIRGYYYCICHAKRIASKTSGCSSGMIDVTKHLIKCPNSRNVSSNATIGQNFWRLRTTSTGDLGLDKRGTNNTATSAWPGKNVMGNILTSVARSKREELESQVLKTWKVDMTL